MTLVLHLALPEELTLPLVVLLAAVDGPPPGRGRAGREPRPPRASLPLSLIQEELLQPPHADISGEIGRVLDQSKYGILYELSRFLLVDSFINQNHLLLPHTF